MQGALLLSKMPTDLVGEKLETERLYDAVNVILSLQSSNGGFSAWEPQNAYSWLEVCYEVTLIRQTYYYIKEKFVRMTTN